MKMTGADVLEQAASVYRERNAVYGNNYERLGRAMTALFPDGLELRTDKDWTRLYLLFLTIVKISRYAVNFNKGGHSDSSIDASVYAAMLHAIDQEEEVNARRAV